MPICRGLSRSQRRNASSPRQKSLLSTRLRTDVQARRVGTVHVRVGLGEGAMQRSAPDLVEPERRTRSEARCLVIDEVGTRLVHAVAVGTAEIAERVVVAGRRARSEEHALGEGEELPAQGGAELSARAAVRGRRGETVVVLRDRRGTRLVPNACGVGPATRRGGAIPATFARGSTDLSPTCSGSARPAKGRRASTA